MPGSAFWMCEINNLRIKERKGLGAGMGEIEKAGDLKS
jgi:hypothetical protein